MGLLTVDNLHKLLLLSLFLRLLLFLLLLLYSLNLSETLSRISPEE